MDNTDKKIFFLFKTTALTLITLLFIANTLFAANYYIRSGATGNGSGNDWTNAMTQLPRTLLRGDTYYLADGIYDNYRFDDDESGSNFIYIKKATPSDHGTETGWDNSYGDNQAVFTGGLDFYTGYWYIDGQIGSGKGESTPYGIKVECPTPSGRGIEILYNSSYITLRYIEVSGNGDDGNGSAQADDGLYINTASSNHIFANMYLHDFGRAPILWRNVTDSIVEYCYIKKNESTSGQHAEGVSAVGGKNIIRYNIWEQIEGTGIIMIADADGWEIYGNLIFNSSSNNGSIATWGGHPIHNTKVYNNSIIDTVGIDQGIDLEGTNNSAYNNLFYNCSGAIQFGDTSHDYNTFDDGTYGEPNGQRLSDGTSLFVDYNNNNFNLAIPTEAGRSFSAPYNEDMRGYLRGNDGVWDRGAYEFISGGSTTTTTPTTTTTTITEQPNPPENLRITLE